MVKGTATPVGSRQITLVMDEDIARTLLQVSRSIGGDPIKTRRGHMDQIGTALSGLAVSAAGVLDSKYDSLYFKEEE
jgi:hypothetical protein